VQAESLSREDGVTDLARALHDLAERVADLEPARVVGELEAPRSLLRRGTAAYGR
jgi:hypothetical protein